MSEETERAFQIDETVPMKAEIKVAGTLHDPTESILVTLWDKDGTVVFTDQAATKEATGKYVYFWNPTTGAKKGEYVYRYFTQDGSGAGAKKTIVYKTFTLQ